MVQVQLILMGILLCGLLSSCGTSARSADEVLNAGQTPRQLKSCPASPNCHCSEYEDVQGWIAPLVFQGEADRAWAKAVQLVEKLGGDIQSRNDIYLHAVFTTSIFRFKDDLELRLDAEHKRIHVRSASQVGHSDFGVNRRRIERLRSRFVEDSLKK